MIKKIIIFLFVTFNTLLLANNVFLDKIIKQNQIDIYLVNENLYDISIKYNAKVKNLLSADDFPIKNTLKAQSRKLITSFFITGKKYSLKSEYKHVIGNFNVIHDDTYNYMLPYKNNTQHIVSQGFNGVFSHKGNSLYAIDFKMRENTKIYASREGLVVKITEDSKLVVKIKSI
jgi:murein DD-endopeptidase MepM/ murein hydrolase activator NlpD